MATRAQSSRKPGNHSGTATPTSPKFEIVAEELHPAARSWEALSIAVGPFFEAGRNLLGDVYASLAQAVFEQKEDFEDRRAARKAELRLARRRAPQIKSPPLLLEAGSLPAKGKTKSSQPTP